MLFNDGIELFYLFLKSYNKCVVITFDVVL